MDLFPASMILLAGVSAGTINAVVGSGSLITFPTLIAFGYPPVLANISNNIGMVPGGLSGTLGYRRELRGQGHRLIALGSMSFVGGATGALLLLVMPASAFHAVVPLLLAISLVLVVLQPRMATALAGRRMRRGRLRPTGNGGAAKTGVGLAGVYGGYFGGAQGILLMGMLATLLPESLQRVNAMKNALATIVNSIATVIFVAVARDQVDWAVVGLIAVGSACGGVFGARVGRLLPQPVLRGIIVVVGVIAIVELVR